MATVRLDGAVHHVEHTAPYGFPDDNGTTATTGRFGIGSHTVEFEFYVEGTTTVSGRGCVTVQEGSPASCGDGDADSRGPSGHRPMGGEGYHNRPPGSHGDGALRWGRASCRTHRAL